MKVDIVSKESIRPSNPTPPHLKTYKLSLLDLHATPFYTPIFLFYSNHTQSKPTERSCCLKRSLSQTLTKYYPFAGRYTDDESAIDCNDEGVEFWEARIDCTLSDILKRPDSDDLNVLFPPGFMWKQSLDGSIVAIQVNFFDCGGMAVNVCMSHNIADGSSISTFLYDWATMACRSGKQVSPQFIDSSIISPNIVVSVVPKFELVESSNHVTRRFVFEAEKITELKAIVRDSKAEDNPTRVQVVTALLYKCAIKASHANLGSLKNSRMCHLVNMRSRMDPPLPTNSIGNFVWYFMVSNNGKMLTLEELVDQLKNGMAKLCDKEKNNMKVNDWLLGVVKSWGEVNKIVGEDVETYRCSSFCRFPMYQVDFGWGKPMWVSCANPVVKNSFVLMDAQKGDGIEALVILDEQEMAIFQCDEELLAFASLKSNIFHYGVCLNTNAS